MLVCVSCPWCEKSSDEVASEDDDLWRHKMSAAPACITHTHMDVYPRSLTLWLAIALGLLLAAAAADDDDETHRVVLLLLFHHLAAAPQGSHGKDKGRRQGAAAEEGDHPQAPSSHGMWLCRCGVVQRKGVSGVVAW